MRHSVGRSNQAVTFLFAACEVPRSNPTSAALTDIATYSLWHGLHTIGNVRWVSRSGEAKLMPNCYTLFTLLYLEVCTGRYFQGLRDARPVQTSTHTRTAVT